MNFVNQVDLEAASCRRVLNVIKELSGIFNTGTGCCIDFNQVNEAAFCNFTARRALAAGSCADALLAVEAFGQNPGNRRFTNTAGAGKQVRMMETPFIQRIDERAQNVLLPDHFIKETRTPFSRKYLITHENLFGLNTCIQLA